jgi:hypothetical protein
MQIMVVIVGAVGGQPLGGPGELKERLSPRLGRRGWVNVKQLLEPGVQPLEFRPAKVRQFREDFLRAHSG